MKWVPINALVERRLERQPERADMNALDIERAKVDASKKEREPGEIRVGDAVRVKGQPREQGEVLGIVVRQIDSLHVSGLRRMTGNVGWFVVRSPRAIYRQKNGRGVKQKAFPPSQLERIT